MHSDWHQQQTAWRYMNIPDEGWDALLNWIPRDAKSGPLTIRAIYELSGHKWPNSLEEANRLIPRDPSYALKLNGLGITKLRQLWRLLDRPTPEQPQCPKCGDTRWGHNMVECHNNTYTKKPR